MNDGAVRTVLITGGSGTLAGATRILLLEQGWHVFAADCNRRTLAQLEGLPGVTPLYLDVTEPDSVAQGVTAVRRHTERLDAIIHFAGILAVGSMIEMDEATLQRVIDVNLLGTFRINRAFFPLLRPPRSRIVTISSETGWQSAAPFNGAYALSKHGIEAYSDALRRELALLAIPVIKIQPGPFRSEMTASIEANFQRAAAQSMHFRPLLQRLEPLAAAEGARARDPAILAAVVLKALTARRPRPAYSVKPATLRSLLEFLPVRWMDWLVQLGLRRLLR